VHLVDVVDGKDGISFAASEDAPSFLAMLKAPYTVELKKRAAWMAERFASLSKAAIRDLVDDKIGRWTAEFQIPHSSTS
jgi:primosomal protein N''